MNPIALAEELYQSQERGWQSRENFETLIRKHLQPKEDGHPAATHTYGKSGNCDCESCRKLKEPSEAEREFRDPTTGSVISGEKA